MQIDQKLISRLEHLARLELSAAEREKIRLDLNAILEMVEKLNELDTGGVEPLVYINDAVNILREDVVEHQVDQRAALSNAPDHDHRFFRVPKVIDL